MATNIKVGDRVRIKKSYGYLFAGPSWEDIGKNKVGTEFKVTDVVRARGVGTDDTHYVKGDPQGRGIWAKYVEVVEEREPKMFTTTTLATRHEWDNEDRIVSVTSGRAGVSLTVKPNPSLCGDMSGTTGLTPEQAEQLANDLLERVAEIRQGLKEEAGE